MTDRSQFAAPHQPAPPRVFDDDEDDDFMDINDDHEQRKQMTYGELVRKFSMHNEKIQKAYFDSKQRLEVEFDFNQFIRCRK